METLRVTMKVVSPLFMNGAQSGRPEIRAASIKGALRFWYRAICLSRLYCWQEVKREEMRVFGSTEQNGDSNKISGQANFLLKVVPLTVKVADSFETQNKHGLLYLGYGPVSFKGVQRSFITVGSTFDIVIVFKRFAIESYRGLTEQDVHDLEHAIHALNFFGGVGTRSRRGFGSLNIVDWQASYGPQSRWVVPRSAEGLKTQIEAWCSGLEPFASSQPEYTAFSTASKSIVVRSGKPWLETLNEVGKTFLAFRTSGRANRDIKGGASGENRMLPWNAPVTPRFWDDHDLVYNNKRSDQTPSAAPRRIVFGLPHNYYYSSDNSNVSVDVIRDGDRQRRASPLFIHAHEVGSETTKDKECVVILTTFPSRFLPESDGIKIQASNLVKPNVDYSILNKLLEVFKSPLEVRINDR